MCQIFRWNHRSWDIDRLLRDIRAGALIPDLVELDPSFAQLYGQRVLVGGPQRIALDVKHALIDAPDRLSEPIVLLYAGREEGIVAPYEDAPECNGWIVGDGNHRVLAAGLHGRWLRAYVLTEEQSRNYEMGED